MNCIDVNIVCWRGRSSTWGSSSVNVLPVLKWLYHSIHCVQLVHSSPKACWSIFHISVAVFPSLKQNFTHTHILPSPSFSLPKKNRKLVTALVYFSGCSSFTGSDRVMRQEVLCYQRLPLSTPLARVRSIHWFRRCELISVLYWSYLVQCVPPKYRKYCLWTVHDLRVSHICWFGFPSCRI